MHNLLQAKSNRGNAFSRSQSEGQVQSAVEGSALTTKHGSCLSVLKAQRSQKASWSITGYARRAFDSKTAARELHKSWLQVDVKQSDNASLEPRGICVLITSCYDTQASELRQVYPHHSNFPCCRFDG